MVKYNLLLRIIHWLMAIVILSMIISGFVMTSIDGDQYPLLGDIYKLHKSFGVIAFLLIIFRIIVRFITHIPPYPISIKHIYRKLSIATHYILYLLMILAPLTGIIMSMAAGRNIPFFWTELPNFIEKNKELSIYMHDLHEIIPYILGAVVLLHVLATIKHEILDKINILSRIKL